MFSRIDFHHVIHTNLYPRLAEMRILLQGENVGFEGIPLVQGVWNLVEVESKEDWLRAIVISQAESMLDKLIIQKRVPVMDLLWT